MENFIHEMPMHFVACSVEMKLVDKDLKMGDGIRHLEMYEI